MNNVFYFIGYERFTLNQQDMLKITILDFKTKTIHNIFKTCRKDLLDKLQSVKLFDNITSSITYVIKRNGQVSLDIKE